MRWTFRAFAVTEMTWEALRAAHEPCGDVWKTVVSVRHGFRSCCDISIGQFFFACRLDIFLLKLLPPRPGTTWNPFFNIFSKLFLEAFDVFIQDEDGSLQVSGAENIQSGTEGAPKIWGSNFPGSQWCCPPWFRNVQDMFLEKIQLLKMGYTI